MKLAITRFAIVAAIAVLMVAVGSTAAWAQTPCPNSPNYSPDFTGATFTTVEGAPGCLTANGTAALGAPAFSLRQPTGTTNPALPDPTNVTTVLRVTPNATAVAGSVWYNAEQSVTAAFSTTFTFQLSGSQVTGYGPADGIAFVIQASGPSALGPAGCGEGFAQGSCSTPTGGITNSLAVDFKTYNDGYPDPNNNSVSIVSAGTGPNCIDQACNIAYNNSLPNAPNSNTPINLADGGVHTVTISYTPTPTQSSSPNCFSGSTAEPCLDVILDGIDLFSGGVQLILNGTTTPLSLSTLIGNSSSAWVGFTGGTGGGDDNQDILSWTFTPLAQSQTAPVTPSVPATYNINGGCNYNGSGCPGNGFTSTVAENPGSTLTINNLVVTPIPIISGDGSNPAANQAACNAIVNPPSISPAPWASPSGSSPEQTAECFVYTNGGGMGIDAPVMFAVTCPPSGICDTTANPFYAAESYFFNFTCTENSPLMPSNCSSSSPSSFGNFTSPLGPTSATGLPAVGVLQGAGPDPNNPCTPATGTNPPPLFSSNQIVSFTLGDGASSTPTKAGSPGLTACYVATYDTPNEIPTITGLTINGSSPMNGATYQQGSSVTANYTCNSVSTAPDSVLGSSYPAAGPYLTVNSCTATSGLTAGGGTPTTGSPCTFASNVLDTCSSMIALDTSEVGAHTLTVQVEDSALNTNSTTVTYNVVAATNVAIANIAASQTTPGSKLTYIIGVGDLGAANA
ncbi:MAG: L-type lectin-domain containing protein, partial [Candidatus Sulfotelmatobacter sp.]